MWDWSTDSLENLSVFMVAKDNGVSKHSGGLSELRDLNNLRGWLHIKNLRYVKDPASEFEAANLKEKQHLQTLILAWRFGDPDDNNSDSGPNDVEISLEKLRPHVNLKWLIVFGCGRLMFPNWISFLTNLVELKIVNCKNCQHFPPLDQFPSLKRLGLHNLNDLEYIESGIKCHNALFFPSLENLWLENCPNLQGWRKPQLLQFHCIVYLQITSCPNLTSMPLIPSIQHLVLINACKKLLEDKLKMKISVSQSTSSCSSISTSQLKVLQIEGIEDLEFLSEDLLQNLTSLQSLYIRNCPRLRNLSSRHLSSLVFLVIKACEELDLSDDMQWHYLRSLRKLQFRNMNKLVSLPKGLQHVPTLLTLLIKRCPNLISLPEWMRSLTELQYLFIKKCPQLSERYESNMCADWAEIGYIPNISIDKRWIQEDGCYKL
ncbi:hypothetical protein GH714_001989 [Hevea brasiliensis]|uniref:R13L1/DRL21-like LRR repeat region domain-containing protein n=1 Tax=Hevea brasiliensis TaxID=3981 RepID=A0A6A6M803_HEVBR|nr:hypothetical protein GH714_001989 [Hevea brasiliensis]